MNKTFIFGSLGVGILLQSFFTTIPVLIGVLLLMYIFERSEMVFLLGILCGILVDIFAINTLGLSSMVFVGVLGVVHIYERKFEIQTREFVLLWTFLGSTVYLFVLGNNSIFMQSFANAAFSLVCFLGIKHVQRSRVE